MVKETSSLNLASFGRPRWRGQSGVQIAKWTLRQNADRPWATCKRIEENSCSGRKRPRRLTDSYFTMSLSDLRGRTFTTLRAGFALNIVSWPVNGLIPLRGLVAGLWITVIFIRPGTANTPGPFLPTLRPINPESASSTAATFFRDSSVSWASAFNTSLFDIGLLAPLFVAIAHS